MSICCTCKFDIERSLTNFCKNKNTKDGLSNQCKSCAKLYREKNKTNRNKYPSYSSEYRNEYILENKDHINNLRKERYAKDPDAFKNQNKISYLKK